MKILIYVLFILAFFVLACSSLGDETDKAGELVTKANEDLREIRKIQKANFSKLEELKEAMSSKDTPRVQKILDELIDAIEDGIALGETARARIGDASEKKTNEKFKEYLRLKEEALGKQIDAFKFRVSVAKTLRDKFGTSDQAEIEKAKMEFQQQEESFQKLWDAAEDLNERATKLARDNPNKVRAK